jgi:uncharacterized protein (DUF2235 family)
MGRQTAVCGDATCVAADKQGGGVAEPTNAAKLAPCLCRRAECDQLVFYEQDVGLTPNGRLIGSLFGYGLPHTICSAYRFPRS